MFILNGNKYLVSWMACLCISGAFRSTPTTEVLLAIMFDFSIIAGANLAAYRMVYTSMWRGSCWSKGHGIIKKDESNYFVLTMRNDYMSKKISQTIPFDVTIQKRGH